MLQISKLVLIAPLAAPLALVSNFTPLQITSIDVEENNEGIIVKGEYKVVTKIYSSAFISLSMKINGKKESIKTVYITTMINDGEIVSEIIPYSKINDVSLLTFEIAPTGKSYTSTSQTIKYNPSQNASKYITISEKDNNIPIASGYYKENYNIDESKIERIYQTFTISNYEDIKVNEVYKYFDIRYINLKYQNGLDNLLSGDFSFSFYDSYNLFKDFPTREGTMFKTIPLKLNKVEDTYHLSFAHNLYFEPNTHFVSYKPVEGYIETNLLYFPLEYADKLKEIRAQISFDIKDKFSFNVTGEFKIRYIKKYFGDCDDSEYCITSSEDTNENVYEKVVDVQL